MQHARCFSNCCENSFDRSSSEKDWFILTEDEGAVHPGGKLWQQKRETAGAITSTIRSREGWALMTNFLSSFLSSPLLPAPPTGTSGQRMGPAHLGRIFQPQSSLETPSQTCPEFYLLGYSRYSAIVHIHLHGWIQKWCAHIPKRVQVLLSHGLSWETRIR